MYPCMIPKINQYRMEAAQFSNGIELSINKKWERNKIEHPSNSRPSVLQIAMLPGGQTCWSKVIWNFGTENIHI